MHKCITRSRWVKSVLMDDKDLAQISSAKICSILFTTWKRNFHWIWIMSEKLSVKWVQKYGFHNPDALLSSWNITKNLSWVTRHKCLGGCIATRNCKLFEKIYGYLAFNELWLISYNWHNMITLPGRNTTDAHRNTCCMKTPSWISLFD